MRIAYIGSDFFSSCLQLLTSTTDLEVKICVTGEPGEAIEDIVRICNQNQIPLIHGRIDKETVNMINSLDIDLLVSAAYTFKIPISDLNVKKAINIHPSLLPVGRGPNPLPNFLDGEQDHCGITIQELAPNFDIGGNIISRSIHVEKSDDYNSLALKMFATAPFLLKDFLEKSEHLWEQREQQTEGTYWAKYTDDDRTINASSTSICEAEKVSRKFGTLGIKIKLSTGSCIDAARIVTAQCEHNYQPGNIIAMMSIGGIIAFPDGLVRVMYTL